MNSRVVNPLPQLIPYRVMRAMSRLRSQIWESTSEIAVSGGPVHDTTIPLSVAKAEGLMPLVKGERFGADYAKWGFRWLRLEVPSAANVERERRFLIWNGSGEVTVYIDDKPYAGLDAWHTTCPLPDEAREIWLSNGLWNVDKFGVVFDSAQIGIRDQDGWDAYWDCSALYELLKYHYKKELDVDLTEFRAVGFQPPHDVVSPYLRSLLRAFDDAIDALDNDGLEAFRLSIARFMERFPAEIWQPRGTLTGHAHIDCVWLWPEHVVQQKAVHSFATQLRLMERYPEYRFTQSQPALYRAVEGLAPSVVEEIRDRIREKRWEATGAFEVESDTHVPCGESLVRQVLIGQRKFADLRGGERSRVCWIPDVFGYSAVLPQILALGGVPFFYTTKMTWSNITRFPYNSFIWRGSDGTEVITCLCSTGYNHNVMPDDFNLAMAMHRQADVHPEMLFPTGFGDGGGGVTEDMLERARRYSNLAGAARLEWGSAEEFFERLEARRDALPVYQGELYLEYHRGTYTTQSEFKRCHRALEKALQTREAVRVVRGMTPLADEEWTRLLFCEFHDAIPGSSIREVYRDLTPELARQEEEQLAAARSEAGKGNVDVAFNPLAIARTVVIERDSVAKTLLHLPGLTSRPVSSGTVPQPFVEVTGSVLDNGVLRAVFDSEGNLAALSVRGKQLDLEGATTFTLYYDEAHLFDAWDIDHYVYKHPQPVMAGLNLELAESGPIRARLRGECALGKRSHLGVDYILDAEAEWLRVEVRVDWKEDHRLLKFHAPTGYRGRFARFANPFGSIQRPQHPGTQSDEAMWEVPGNRWAAVTDDAGEGLAIVTDAKYGWSCREGNLGLTLLRSPREPDEQADLGQHRIQFAIGRHQELSTGASLSTAAAAEALFAPVVVGKLDMAPAPFQLTNLGSLVPSWVLPSEGGGFVIRAHETCGVSGVARLRLAEFATVELVDFLETKLGNPVAISEKEYDIPYRAYEIVSILVRR